jgi:hypothetical protein
LAEFLETLVARKLYREAGELFIRWARSSRDGWLQALALMNEPYAAKMLNTLPAGETVQLILRAARRDRARVRNLAGILGFLHQEGERPSMSWRP